MKTKYAIVMKLEGAAGPFKETIVFDTVQDCRDFIRNEFREGLHHGEPCVNYGDNVIRRYEVTQVYYYGKD